MRSIVVEPFGISPGDHLPRQRLDAVERNRPVGELFHGYVDVRRARRRRVVRVSVDVGAAVGDRREWHVRENERHVAVECTGRSRCRRNRRRATRRTRSGRGCRQPGSWSRPGPSRIRCQVASHSAVRMAISPTNISISVLADGGVPVGVQMRIHCLDVFERPVRVANDVLVAEVQVRPYPRRVRPSPRDCGRGGHGMLSTSPGTSAESAAIPLPAPPASSCLSYNRLNDLGVHSRQRRRSRLVWRFGLDLSCSRRSSRRLRAEPGRSMPASEPACLPFRSRWAAVRTCVRRLRESA